MFILRKLTLAAALLASAATTVVAADLEGPRRYAAPPEPTYVRPFSWTGLYVGVHGGAGWTDADWNFAASSLGHSGYGGLLGGQIGYNIQAGRAVVGLEGDASGAWLGGSDPCPNPAWGCSHDVNWLASFRARLGFTMNGNRTLVYGTAGAAWADASFATRDAANNPFGSSVSTTKQGWVAGAGIEHMLTQHLSARFEYLYYGFDGINAPAGTLDTAATKIDLSSQVLRFGLNYKF